MKTKGSRRLDGTLTVVFSIICVIYALPIVIVLVNSFKDRLLLTADPFSFPTGDALSQRSAGFSR